MSSTHVLTPDEQSLLRDRIAREGLRAFARRIGAHVDTVARLAAGSSGRLGSLHQVRAALRAAEADVP